VAAAEILMLAISGHAVVTCSYARCNSDRVYDWEEAQVLLLFAVLIVVRVLFLVVEHALLVRMITYYQRVLVIQGTHSTHKGSSLIMAGDKLHGGGIAVKTTIGFKKEVRRILGGASSWTTHVLILSVFVQVTVWCADFRTTIFVAYDPSKSVREVVEYSS
jgi:hypothetical protein